MARIIGRLAELARSHPRRVTGLAAFAAAALAAGLWVRMGPLPDGFLEARSRVSCEVVDRRGRPLYEALSSEGTRSAWLSADRLPEVVVKATLAAEDRRFFSHPGVDPLAILRAAWHDLRAMRLAEGGSTLTQQAVKRLMNRPRTPAGKLREVVLALRLEHRLTKREILALYLNVAPYGNQFVGLSAASRGYFGCPPELLTPAQAAFLAGLPQRPTAFNPFRRFDEATRRQRWVLGRMRSLGYLDATAYDTALAERLTPVRRPGAFAAPHFVERVMAEAGEGAVRVETTLDLDLQREVQGIIAARRDDLVRHGARNAAVVVLDNLTGGWLAWEGSGDYFDVEHGGAIDGCATPRQPGSALKPFTYALAFERGFTPASILPDIPSHFPTAEPGILYGPRNYDGAFRGPMRARPALAGSENVPAVWLLSRVGVPDLLGFLRGLGFSTLDKKADYYGYGLTLGDAEVRLDELAAAYAAFARGGVWVAPRAVTSVVSSSGTRSAGTAEEGRRVISPLAAHWVADILSDAGARAYAFGTGGSLDFPFAVAAKTGTSQAYRDNWCVGFTREVTVGVWVGNFDRKELTGSSGVTGAGPIFHDVMLAARKLTARASSDRASGALVPAPGR